MKRISIVLMTVFACSAVVLWALPAQAEAGAGTRVVVDQEMGKAVYWVVPGPRRIDPVVFGTPAHPTMGDDTLAIRMWQVSQLPAPLNMQVKAILDAMPWLVALPTSMREVSADGQQYTMTSFPTPMSDDARITSGRLHIVYEDNQPWDTPGDPTMSADRCTADVMFTDPAGNEYTVRLKSVLMPPLPGNETGGGVVTNNRLHGLTGTDTPLFPSIFAYAASWNIGDLMMNGEVVNENMVIHFMTTEIARDKDYRLAFDEQLPLAMDDTIAGQTHHTHIVVAPIMVGPDGPVVQPVHTGFALPNGEMQPFIHLMWEQDRIVESPYVMEPMAPMPPMVMTTAPVMAAPMAPEDAMVTVTCTEFAFEPKQITVPVGQPVKLTLVNQGALAHNLRVGEFNAQTKTIPGGHSDTIIFTPTKKGEFPFWCTVPGHRQAGMEGQLMVQ